MDKEVQIQRDTSAKTTADYYGGRHGAQYWAWLAHCDIRSTICKHELFLIVTVESLCSCILPLVLSKPKQITEF